MFPAALRFALATLLPLVAAAAADPARAAPMRPPVNAPPGGGSIDAKTRATIPAKSRKLSAVPITRFNGLAYVPLREAAIIIGMKSLWVEKNRQLVLTDASSRLEFEGNSREISVDGLRLFLGKPVVVKNGLCYITQIDFERILVGRIRPGLLPSPLPRPKVIALDPGHGGGDSGFEDKRLGLKEKILTLDVAQRMQKLLVARGYKVVLTRTDDRQLGPDKTTDFRTRAEIANRANADLFVSVHFNSLFPDTKTSGTETYAFTPQFMRSDRAQSVTQPDDTEKDPAPVNRYDPWSALLSQSIQQEVINALKTGDRGQKTMHSGVMRWLDCPGVLVESLFLSNDFEANMASTPAGRQRIAAAIVAGIELYADTLSALAPKPRPTP
ncbi:MAG: N-acetylmuramoyl-L-alanine amidase [Verrucomicrobia bacterium]|nr:N-acetylmuramoyl-L-alanine amidase [Verrucomicrobiota bacterium]